MIPYNDPFTLFVLPSGPWAGIVSRARRLRHYLGVPPHVGPAADELGPILGEPEPLLLFRHPDPIPLLQDQFVSSDPSEPRVTCGVDRNPVPCAAMIVEV